ncbi:MAG: MetQ/NlpA family ABC transporter substrate-binding protein [Spirochaetaceae bacterium]|jgi:D-methionine transport system substrate-binding protein|nr:MetQ/NlpA family ABC transporter substrate-binding protein [Spirochaetaceae bacterium]
MKKLSFIVLAGVLVAGIAFAGGAKQQNTSLLTVGASPTPHAVLLNLVKDDFKALGYDLRVVEFSDYVVPNTALISGDLDANYFQHIPYLESNEEWVAKLSFAWGVHIEPFGLYSRKYQSVAAIPDGATIAIPSDPTNGGRALLLFQANGLLKVNPAAGLTPTDLDITENPHNYRFRALEAAQLPRSLGDVDAACINGNYAIDAGLSPASDALIIEGSDSPYVNGVVVRKGSENDPRITALKQVLQSQKVRDYIATSKEFAGGVVPIF